MYSLSCKDMGMMDCEFVAKGETKEEALKMSAEHGQTVHADKMKAMMATMSMDDMNKMMESKMKMM